MLGAQYLIKQRNKLSLSLRLAGEALQLQAIRIRSPDLLPSETELSKVELYAVLQPLSNTAQFQFYCPCMLSMLFLKSISRLAVTEITRLSV